MAKTPRIQLSKTAVARKPHHWETEYFSSEDIIHIVKESGVPLNGTVSKVRFGRKEKIRRKDLLKSELNSIAAYWRGKLAMQKSGNKDEVTLHPYPERTKDDHLLDYLILQLGELWTDHNIFQQEKVGTSIAAPTSQVLGSRDGSAGGPFVRFAIACCKVLGVKKTSNAIRSSIRKRREE